ncbi:MAG: hypothetical protein GY708_29500 [Actinomycetia bacterium]|nr:hypothetical protein [Actinomycetes bacterium]
MKRLRRRALREQELAVAQRKLGDRRMDQGRDKKAKAHYESSQDHLRAATKLNQRAKRLRKRRQEARTIG